MISTRSESGFSLIELLVAITLLLVVSSIVTSALMQMTQSQTTIWNRTEMHSGIRGATELLQQEVGQAGRAALSATVSLLAPVGPTAGGPCNPDTPTAPGDTVAVVSKDDKGNVVTSVNGINPLSGIFAQAGANPSYMLMATLDGDNQEVVKIGAVDQVASTITACFANPHLAGTVLMPIGAFATGIVPNVGIANGSTATVLKLYGDIIGDGNMVYVEYTCDTVNHNLYRNVMRYDAVAKPAVTNAQILLSNIIDNPGGTDCFTYQTTKLNVQGIDVYFVLDVAVTLTVQTQQLDPITKQYQTETKALLNVSPRNVFTAWEMASLDFTDHVQSTPVSVTALLP
ncbi:MAG: prepilin-type N-terminal cleavage/methylation domain-containing protein [Acidobacteriia bacterium]|nr:prepilin-type N-terminal cleavage/methylation domain-containing protein [Terriglobia bacterium]